MLPVLIVEDNTVLRIALKGLLTARFPSLEIDEASSGAEAMSEFRKRAPFLIFMDIRLPDKSGLEVTRAIKESSPKTEIVILTSHDMPEYREAALHSGASHFMTKGDVKIGVITSLVASALKMS